MLSRVLFLASQGDFAGLMEPAAHPGEGHLSINDLIFGPPLATEQEKAERISPAKGLPIFGLDARSSAAYGPEAALTLLIPLGMAGVAYIWPITVGTVVLLCIVFLLPADDHRVSARRRILYRCHGKSGRPRGAVAAAALMIDYVLTAAVGISAGVGALVSAVPSLQHQTLRLCLGILILITIVNLRGMQESGGVFLLPTYLFIACLLGLIAYGLYQTIAAGGHPIPVIAPPTLPGHRGCQRMAPLAGFLQRLHGNDGC